MHVHVDESGEDRGVGQIQPRRRRRLQMRSDRDDPSAANEDRTRSQRSGARAIDKRRRGDEDVAI